MLILKVANSREHRNLRLILAFCFIHCFISITATAISQDKVITSTQDNKLVPVLDCTKVSKTDVKSTKSYYSIKERTEFDPCKSDIPNAPEVYGVEVKDYVTPRLATILCPTGACHLDNVLAGTESEVFLRNLNGALVKQLRDSNQSIAYTGRASYEILVTTKPQVSASGDVKTWYQVRLVARPCTGNFEKPFYMCGIYGGATFITKQTNEDKPSKVSYLMDDLCNKLEKTVLDSIAAAKQ